MLRCGIHHLFLGGSRTASRHTQSPLSGCFSDVKFNLENLLCLLLCSLVLYVYTIYTYTCFFCQVFPPQNSFPVDHLADSRGLWRSVTFPGFWCLFSYPNPVAKSFLKTHRSKKTQKSVVPHTFRSKLSIITVSVFDRFFASIYNHGKQSHTDIDVTCWHVWSSSAEVVYLQLDTPFQ